MEESWRARLPLRCSACSSLYWDARRPQRAGTIQVSSVRPQSEADGIVNAAKQNSGLRADDACFRALVPGLRSHNQPARWLASVSSSASALLHRLLHATHLTQSILIVRQCLWAVHRSAAFLQVKRMDSSLVIKRDP
jgi:hypothetical protein